MMHARPDMMPGSAHLRPYMMAGSPYIVSGGMHSVLDDAPGMVERSAPLRESSRQGQTDAQAKQDSETEEPFHGLLPGKWAGEGYCLPLPVSYAKGHLWFPARLLCFAGFCLRCRTAP